MQKQQEKIIEATATYVRDELAGAEGGHDWFHIERVWRNSLLLLKDYKEADTLVVQLASLLHDIADPKFYDGDEDIGPRMARDFLESLDVVGEVIEHVENIIKHMSFKNSIEGQEWTSLELQLVQDADRLDALGAIGIARTFNYGGHKGRALYNPEIKPNLKMTKEEYKNSTAPTLNHFYEKLFLLKDKMNTESGRKMAETRHAYMEEFVAEFIAEWNGEK